MYKYLVLLFWAHLCVAEVTKIFSPCELNDYKCIGENLSANSKCKQKVKGFVPPKLLVDSFAYDTPYFNASYIDKELIIRNLHKCSVSQFFFNVQTDKVVLSIDCPNVEMESDRTFIQHRTYQEDSYYYFHILGLYPLIRLTINLQSVTQMDLCSAYVFTDVTVLPKLRLDPKNRPTANYLTRDLTDLNIYERENCHTRGRHMASVFIDSMICDYGCPL